MIETDEQRRWWFATHPEYSWSRRGIRAKREDKEIDQRDYSPEDVDAYVAEGLKYHPTGPIAAMLQALKWGLGTNEGPTPLDALLKTTDADKPDSDSKNETERNKEGDETREIIDSALKLTEDFMVGLEDALGINLNFGARTDSRELRKDMKRVNRDIPDDHAAHHIVPTKDARFPEAEEARQILKNWGINLNGEANGVALPYKHGIGEG
jgi:hypothetical protein